FGAAGSGMKRHLEGLLREALSRAIAAGDLRVDGAPAASLEAPADPKFGDLASNVALVLAKQVGRPPRQVAEAILRHVQDPGGWLASTEVAGPGFINFRFALPFWRM